MFGFIAKKHFKEKRKCAAANAAAQKGVTLVEILIYMGLLAIMLVILTDMFASIVGIRAESTAYSSVEQDGRYIMNRLAHDVARADSITTPAAPSVTASSSLVLVIGGVTNTYAVSGGNLELTNGAGTDSLNSSETTISSPSFLRIGNGTADDTIQTTITVTSVQIKKSGTESRNFSTTVSLR